MTNTKQNKANLQSSAKGREKSPADNDKIIAATIDKADATESKDVAKTQREKDIEVNQAKLKTCIGEAVEYLSYTGPKSIHTLRQFLSELNVKGLDYGDQGKALKLRKDADEIMEVLYPVDFAVEQLNKRHAIVLDKVRYVTIGDDGDFSFMEKKDLVNRYENKFIEVPDPATPQQTKKTPIVNIWLKSPDRREISEIVFLPMPSEDERKEIEAKGQHNTWRSFKVQPRSGMGRGSGGRLLYWDHIEEVICAGDSILYTYLRKLMAYYIQQPRERCPSIIIRGGQGCGKDTFAKPFEHILGNHYFLARSTSELECKFNWHLKDKIIICVSEAEIIHKTSRSFYTPSGIKSLIMAENIQFEEKFGPIVKFRNYAHLILLTNTDQPIVLEQNDRRFIVLDASEHRIGVEEYFNGIYGELSDGGYEIFLNDLLTENLDGFKSSGIPFTQAKLDLKMSSLSPADDFLIKAMQDGHFPGCHSPRWDKTPSGSQFDITKDALFQAYNGYATNTAKGEPILSSKLFGSRVKFIIPSVIPDKKQSAAKGGKNIYRLPDIEKARTEYCKKANIPYEKLFKLDDGE